MPGDGNKLLIQRYSTGLHPHIRGTVPFIVRGPNANARHVMRKMLDGFDFSGFVDEEIRLVVAEFMLREGIVQAAWPIELDTCCPPDGRWETAIRQCAQEIPKVSDEWPISLGAWELVDGMSKIEHYTHLLSYDRVVLESMQIPNDILAP